MDGFWGKQRNGYESGRNSRNFCGGGRSAGWLERTLSDALMLTWCLEAPWWVKKGVFAGASVKPARFLEEILWVGEWWKYRDGGLKKETGQEIFKRDSSGKFPAPDSNMGLFL